MVSLLAKIRRVIDDAVGDKEGVVVRKVKFEVIVNNDVTEVEFIDALDDLLRQFGKDVRIVPNLEVYVEGIGWVSESELKDEVVNQYVDLMMEIDEP